MLFKLSSYFLKLFLALHKLHYYSSLPALVKEDKTSNPMGLCGRELACARTEFMWSGRRRRISQLAVELCWAAGGVDRRQKRPIQRKNPSDTLMLNTSDGKKRVIVYFNVWFERGITGILRRKLHTPKIERIL